MYTEQKDAKELISLGRDEEDKYNYLKALEYYNKAIKIDSHNSDYFCTRATLRQEMQDYLGAIQDFTESIRLTEQPQHHIHIYFIRGYVYYLGGNDKRAKKEFLFATEIYQDDFEVYFFQIEYLCAIGEYKEAIRICNKLIKNYPDAEWYSERAKVYLILKDFKQAIRDFDKAIKIEPDGSNYLHRGEVYLAKGDYLKAIYDFTKAIELKMNYSQVYQQRGDALYHIQDFTGAIKDYTQVIQKEPHNGHAYSSRGRAYIAANQKKLANDDFMQAAHLFMDDNDVDNCQKALNLVIMHRTEADIKHQEYIRMKRISGW